MRTILFMFLLLGLIGGPVYADDERRNKPAREGDDDNIARDVANAGVGAAFEELERQLITKFFGEHRGYYRDQGREYEDDNENAKGKGKHKKKGLPPGIAMKLERGGTLPPGIAKKNLPDDLEQKLPPVRQGYERRVVDRDVLLVESATGRIADIIVGAILDE